MVDGVSSLNRAISVLRVRMQAAAKTTKGGSSGARRPNDVPAKAGSGAIESHVSTLATRLLALTGDRRAQAKAAIRLFVEAVLLDEFGSQYLLSQNFQELVEKVAVTMESDSSLNSLIDAALAELWEQSSAR